MKASHVPGRNSCISMLLSTAAAWAVGSVSSFAGPLDPPIGPVAPTAKPLSEVEPRTAISAANTPGDADSVFKITQPGSYYLTGNITGVVGKHGIEIVASGVTLDLNGFDLVGIPGMGAFDGVSVTLNSLTNIAVLNGSVRNWGRSGVNLAPAGVFSSRVANLFASGNAGNGILTSNNCTVSNCSAFSNTGNGINTGAGCTVSNSTAYANASAGISTGIGCTVSNCSAITNTGSGISTSLGCMVTNCTAYQNTGNGIITSNGSTIADCVTSNNTLDGIRCFGSCVIRASSCSGDGNGGGDGAGIHATGSDNRIEGNNCTGADRGIDVDAAGNFIIKNTCSGNTTNWTIAGQNKCLVILGSNAVGINGDSGGISPGSSDPNANYTY